jgi:predicted  nucleic acid-binding Zn-ribbon protein
MIKSLNREIDDLKKEVKTKDREITRLKNELERL